MKQEIKDGRNQRIGYMDEYVRGRIKISDKNNNTLGELRVQTNGDVEAFKNTNKLGFYDKSLDCTFDNRNNKIGKGDLTMQFFFNN